MEVVKVMVIIDGVYRVCQGIGGAMVIVWVEKGLGFACLGIEMVVFRV